MATIEERVTKLENSMTPIEVGLAALDNRVDDLNKKIDGLFNALDKRLDTFIDAVHQRFNTLETLIRDTHSENGAGG